MGLPLCNVRGNVNATSAGYTTSQIWKLAMTMLRMGYKYIGSSNGVAVEKTGNPLLNLWGAPVAGPGSNAANILNKLDNDILEVDNLLAAGLTGTDYSIDQGKVITFPDAAEVAHRGPFQILKSNTATSCYVGRCLAAASGTDANNGAINWVIYDYDNTVIPALAKDSWICLQGPSTIAVYFDTPTGDIEQFTRGSTLTDDATGAQGLILGTTYDPISGFGTILIHPTKKGDNGDPIFGGWTGGLITNGSIDANAYVPAEEYVREFVFWAKGNSWQHQGLAFYQCMKLSVEQTSRFSDMMASASCTATVAPGGGDVGNTFPTVGTMCFVGKVDGSDYFPDVWHRIAYNPLSDTLGKAQISVVNALRISGTGVNAASDGSFFFSLGLNHIGPNSFGGFAFVAIDDIEDGEADPYVIYAPAYDSTIPFASHQYTGTVGSLPASANASVWRSDAMQNSNYRSFMGFRRRGYGTDDTFVSLAGTSLVCFQGNQDWKTPLTQNVAEKEIEATGVDITRYVLEPLHLVSFASGLKMRKGAPRWMYQTIGFNALDTFGSRRWVQFATSGAEGDTAGVPVILGPWDGTTVPVQ